MRAFFLQLIALVFALSLSEARAMEGEVLEACGALYYHKEAPVRVAAVAVKQPRNYFSKNSDEDKQCPAPSEGCNTKSYLVPGDLVITGRARNGFVCAIYYGPKGKETAGWFPQSALEVRAPLAKTTAGDWIGSWKSLGETAKFVKPNDQRSKITIKRGDRGYLSLQGEMWVVIRENDTPRSGVIGSRRLKPGPGTIAFVDGDDDKKSYEQAEEAGECAVRLARVERYLLVEDDNNCGGMGISFTGLYQR